jgi:hypothetical protein
LALNLNEQLSIPKYFVSFVKWHLICDLKTLVNVSLRACLCVVAGGAANAHVRHSKGSKCTKIRLRQLPLWLPLITISLASAAAKIYMRDAGEILAFSASP